MPSSDRMEMSLSQRFIFQLQKKSKCQCKGRRRARNSALAFQTARGRQGWRKASCFCLKSVLISRYSRAHLGHNGLSPFLVTPAQAGVQ